MTTIDILSLSTVNGGQAAPAAAPAATQTPAPSAGETEMVNSLAVGANANMCSLMDRNSIALGQTPAGTAMAAQADQCWVNLRSQMAGVAPQQ